MARATRNQKCVWTENLDSHQNNRRKPAAKTWTAIKTAKTWTAIETGNLDDRSGKLDSDPETRTANTFRSVIGNLASHHIPVGGYPEVPRSSGHFDGCPDL